MTQLVSGLLLGALVIGAVPDDRPLASPASAGRLVQLLGSREADAVAAEDSEEPGRFVAALVLSDQLLVVAARCDNVEYLRGQVGRQAFRELYADLHGCAIASTKFFVHDMGADGIRLRPEASKVPDIVYETASRQIVLDGDWRKHDLSESGYVSLCLMLDTRYTDMLELLVAALER